MSHRSFGRNLVARLASHAADCCVSVKRWVHQDLEHFLSYIDAVSSNFLEQPLRQSLTPPAAGALPLGVTYDCSASVLVSAYTSGLVVCHDAQSAAVARSFQAVEDSIYLFGQYWLTLIRLHAHLCAPNVDYVSTLMSQIMMHPTTNMALVACSDGTLVGLDLRAAARSFSSKIHSDAMTGCAVDCSGLYVATSSHDGTIRVCDFISRRMLDRFDVTARRSLSPIKVHKFKGDEGVLCVAAHPSMALMAAGGADSVVSVLQ